MRALLAACLLSGVVTADAAAATGDLIQKPGASGCLSVIGFCSPGRALDFAESVTVSPDGKNAYVASQFSNAVTVFDRGADGTLIQKPGSAGCISDSGAARCADGTALEHPVAVTVSPDGTSVYVTSAGSSAVAVFDRAPNGRLAQKSGADGCISDTGAGVCVDGRALDDPLSATVSPDGSSVYVAGTGSDAVVVLDRAPNGTLTQKPRTEGCIMDLADSECADGTALNAPFEVVVSPGGDSVYAAMASDAVAVFDRGTDGSLTQKPGSAGCISETGDDGCVDGTGLDGATSVTVSPNGRSVYVASSNGDSVAMFDRRRNGRLVQKPGASGCISDTGAGPCIDGTDLLGASSVRVSPDGQSAYVANRVSDAVAAFDRAPNGTLAQKPATAGCISDTGAGPCGDGAGLDGALSVAVAPDGQSVYAASSESDAVAVFDREPIPPPSDTTRPLLSALAISPDRFRLAGVGADVTYRLSEPAVRLGVERAVPGRRVRGRCVEPEQSNQRATRCIRHRALPGGFTLSAEAGRNRFTFRGRLRGRKLPPGRYRLRAGATDPSGNTSRTGRVRFGIAGR